MRLLADPRARDQLHRFHAMWLGYRAIPQTADLIAAFNLETTKLIDRVVFDQPASYLTLFTSPDTYLTDTLADQYGLPKPPGGQGWVSYGGGGRAGILSHGSVLAAFSKFSDTSPTQRGIFVQTRFLCNTIQPPPANVNVDQPPPATASACKLDRLRRAPRVGELRILPRNLDPIGLGLGELRHRRVATARTTTVTPSARSPGWESSLATAPSADPAELGQKLVESGQLAQCFVQHVMRYAVGRTTRPEEDAAVEALATSFKASSYSLPELLLGYVASDRFALRQEDPVP